jgi:hypothetical protein
MFQPSHPISIEPLNAIPSDVPPRKEMPPCCRAVKEHLRSIGKNLVAKVPCQAIAMVGSDIIVRVDIRLALAFRQEGTRRTRFCSLHDVLLFLCRAGRYLFIYKASTKHGIIWVWTRLGMARRTLALNKETTHLINRQAINNEGNGFKRPKASSLSGPLRLIDGFPGSDEASRPGRPPDVVSRKTKREASNPQEHWPAEACFGRTVEPWEE